MQQADMTGWSAQLLGYARLRGPDGQGVKLERRAAALLAYLGVEGPADKGAVAGLLWPDSPPATVRNNMRQLLRRLRLLCGGAELVEGDHQQLALSPGLTLDVVRLRRAVGGAVPPDVLASLSQGAGTGLLSGLSFDDCDELARWLDGARTAVDGWVRKAREEEVQRRMDTQDWRAALALAEAWAQQEPESEQAGRHLIQLHYLLGDRGAALAAFERLRATLSHDLGVTPMPETLTLVRSIERSAQRAPPALRPTRRALPLSVLRPPVLVGREEALRQLQEGAAAGQLLFVTGEAGSGKTRLTEEFAASMGNWVRMEARPSDQDVPYASQTRALRVHLARSPDVQLPEWVRVEVSRLLPELGGSSPLPPIVSEADELRFYDAHAEAIALLHRDSDVVIVDDVQFWDQASAKVFMYALTRLLEGKQGARRPVFIDCYRRGELPHYSEANVRKLVDAGVARVIELGTLSAGEVRELLAGLELPDAEHHADALARYTGGNPLYVMETLKHLIETEALHKEWPPRLPPPGRVGPLIQRRMERLSPRARLTAQLAAMADVHFRATLAPEALQLSVEHLHAALAELESAQILVGERFTHDLVMEAVRASVSASAARFLHERLARAFEQDAAPAIVVAHHWMEAGQDERALPFLLTAAQVDERLLPKGQAAGHYARAAMLLEAAGRHEEAVNARAAEARCRRAEGAPAPETSGA
ncbi:transcriptional regulator, AfsR/DnrI/RedD family [Myxococcus hansupus]|uniref:Transcriptional regulator, AfsR/DnrI/RedD family n=1 Tax=Pseudomyxococcus hansupus TaxID=1297742 RepID=A0A0H4WYT9_9BACT|nr:transcriptional regulator, AfsR/DnrI/RedD family [Myxococcus hansupus]